jgi:hypothetical protein
MNILRWVISAPISIVILGLLCGVIEWLLGCIYKILDFIMFWGTRYDVPPVFDFEYEILDFKAFIFITCLSTLISAGISGYIGGLICPRNNSVATSWLFGVIILPILIFSCIAFWNTEHWFYSSVWILDMILVGCLFVGCAYEANKSN